MSYLSLFHFIFLLLTDSNEFTANPTVPPKFNSLGPTSYTSACNPRKLRFLDAIGQEESYPAFAFRLLGKVIMGGNSADTELQVEYMVYVSS